MLPQLADLAETHGPFIEELRRRVFFGVLFFVALFVASFAVSPALIRIFITYFGSSGVAYVATSPFQVFSLSVTIGLSLAATLFLPFFLVELYTFISPALTRHEKQIVSIYVVSSIGLFVFGFCYGVGILYYTMRAIVYFNEQAGLQNLWDVSTFFGQIMGTSVLLGLFFQFPLLLHVLLRYRVLTRAFVSSQRRVVIALSVIIVALLPPTDGLSLLVMALPLIALFEFVLFMQYLSERSVPEAAFVYK